MAAPRCTIAAFAPPSAMMFAVGGTWISPGIGPTVTPWSMGTRTVLWVFRSMIRSRRIFFPIIGRAPPARGSPRAAPLLERPANLEEFVQIGQVVGEFHRLLVLHFPGRHHVRQRPVDRHQFVDVGLHHPPQLVSPVSYTHLRAHETRHD